MIFWHTLSPAQLFEKLQSSHYGISEHEAEKRRKNYGLNELPQKRPPAWYEQFFSQLRSPLIYILSAAALVKLGLREFHGFAAILFVILFNALLGFLQERKADLSIRALKKLSAQKIHGVRGFPKEIEALTLVPGDIFYVESGTKIPADARLIEAHNLSVDESSLTGESIPVLKNPATLPEKTPLQDQSNMIFAGTIVTSGRGTAIVVATGTATQLGQIALLAEQAEPPSSPLKEKLEAFGKKISIATLSLMLLIIIVGVFQGFSLPNLIMTCVSLTVSAIPEGLPIAVTVALSFGLLQMAKKNAIVRKLPTIETLGCTTVICTDKTGTLTKNEMVVDRIFVGYEETLMQKSPSLLLVAKTAYYCSEVRENKDGTYLGDPVDIALKKFGGSISGFDTSLTSELILPFESELRMMACTVYENGESTTYWKGCFETIAAHCSTMWTNGETVPFTREKGELIVSSMAKEGYRVIALAAKKGKSNNPLIEDNLTLIGILGLYDPPRREAQDSVAASVRAGIKVIMVTGDHPETALAIGRQIGLSTQGVLTGEQIDDISDEELTSAMDTISVFARVTPHHKWRIVKLLQDKGEVVAMTGDGVNDAPALQQADIGVALGTGTDVAREASSMVILDNNFATIVEAIKQGRVIFRSLQKMATYLLTTCLGGVLTIAGSVLLGIPLPLLPLQLLWINLVTDGTTTVPLALEGGHGDILALPPRSRSSPFISSTMIVRAITTSVLMMIGTIALFLWDLQSLSLLHARTMAFTTLAFYQIFNALNSRSVRRSLFFSYSKNGSILHRIPFLQNRLLLITLCVCFLLQIAAVEAKLLQPILETTALSFKDWSSVLGVSSTVILIVEVHKWWMVKLQTTHSV